jgi:tetratricopeptide (TPR) repeat protein
LRIQSTPVSIEHLGYEGDLIRKHRRNLPLLRSAVRNEPGEAMNWSRLAETLAALGEIEEAIGACRTALAIFQASSSENDRAAARLAYRVLARHLREAGEPTSGVLAVIDEGLACAPDDYTLQFARAQLLIEQAQHEEALPILEGLTTIVTSGARPHDGAHDIRIFSEFAQELRGLALRRLGRFAEAAEAFEKAAAAAPEDPAYRAEAAAMRGHAALRLGRVAEAAEAFEKAAAAAPENLAYQATATAMRKHAA